MSPRFDLRTPLTVFVLATLAGIVHVQAQSNDSLDRLEREHLAPPVYMPATPIPLVSQPRAWVRPPLEDKLSQRLLTPPTAILPAGARLTQQEQGSQIVRLPAHDQPPLALERDLPAPGRAWLPSPALAYAAGPKADEPQPPAVQRLLLDKRPTPQHDPAAEAARAAVAPLAAVTRTPAPFLLLSIPDPFERSEQVRLLKPPADNDPPSFSNTYPARPALPTEAPASP